MKFIVFFLIVTMLQVSAETNGQQVSISGKDLSLKKVFNEIEKQSGYVFFYDTELLKNAKPVTIKVKNEPVETVLNLVFQNQSLSWSVQNKTITVIGKSNPSFNNNLNRVNGILQLTIDVRGKVTDEEGNPLEGVSVVVKGKNKGTKTTKEGEFYLLDINENAILIFSSIGYENKEIKVSGRSFLSVKLKEAIVKMGSIDIISTGYQTLAKKNTTGSISSISANEIERRSSQSLDQILEGTIPGLSVYNNFSGNRTERSPEIDIQIRGGSAIQGARNNPLFIVDGFPVSELPANLNDIEKIDVLKDAAAAAIWGARAANGVIVITTKRGSKKNLGISYSSNVYFTNRPDYSKLYRAESSDIISFEKEDYDKGFIFPEIFEGSPNGYSPSLGVLIQYGKGQIDLSERDRLLDSLSSISNSKQIEKLLMRTGIRQNHFISISGGNEKIQSYFSTSFDQNKINYIGNSNTSMEMNWRNNYKLAKWLAISTDLHATFGNYNINGGIESDIMQMSPYQMIVDARGNYLYDYSRFNIAENDLLIHQGFYDEHINLLEEARLADNYLKQFSLRPRVGLHWTIFKGLSISNDFYYERIKSNGKNIRHEESFYTRDFINQHISFNNSGEPVYNLPKGDILDLSESTQNNWAVRNQINYINTFQQKHFVNVIGGIEFRKAASTGSTNRKFGYNDDLLSWQTYDALALLNREYTWWNGYPIYFDPTTYDKFSYGDTRDISYYSSGVYTYNDKYTISGSFRVDQSNLFGADPKYRRTPLYSYGIAWDIAKENFMNIPQITVLKLRATSGLTGNYDLSTTPYLVASKTFQAVFNDFRARVTSPYNPKLRWERTRTFDIGVDLGAFNNRVLLTVDFYKKHSYDLLGTSLLDPTVGFSSQRVNAGRMTNNGIEVNLQGDIIRSKNFRWNSRFIFAYNKNKITRNNIADGAPEINRVLGVTEYVEGYARESLWSYKWAGLDERGNPLVYDEKGEKIKNPVFGSLVLSGIYRPPYTGSFNNTFYYKGVFLNVFLVYNMGHVLRREMPSMNGLEFGNSLNYQIKDRWQKPGDEAKTDIPGIQMSWDDFYDGRERAAQYSSNSVIKGDFVRIREVQLGYKLPSGFIRKTPLKAASLILQLNNVGLWTKNKYGIDPEFTDPISGTPFLPSPATQTISLHLEF